MQTTAVGWGFIGAGGVARRQMLPAVAGHPEVRVAAVMVRDPARAQALAEQFGAAAAYDQVADLLADDRVEAVYIATPPNVHAELVCAAAAAGKHILLEKPMAIAVADCDAMIAATARAGVTLAVCFPMRHTHTAARLRQLIDSGRLGQVTYLRAQMTKWYPLAPDAWRADPVQAGGGVLMDLGSHLIDLACYLAGTPIALTASLSQRAWEAPVEDTALVLLQHDTGASAVLEMSFAVSPGGNTIEVAGTQGSAKIATTPYGNVLRIYTGQEEEECKLPEANVYQNELLDFGRALRQGRAPLTSAADGRRNTACLEAAYTAARHHRWESLCC